MKIDELGAFIAQRRKSLKVNQRELALLCGISEHALCKLERGVGNPTFGIVGSVLDALGLEFTVNVKDMEAL